MTLPNFRSPATLPAERERIVMTEHGRLTFNRRSFMATLAATAALPASAAGRSRDMRVALLGQSLIHQDLCGPGWPGMAGIIAQLAKADVVFTDLETAIDAPGAGPPTRTGEVFHASPPSVIDCLKQLG